MFDNIFNPGLTTQLLQLLQNFHYCEILGELFFLSFFKILRHLSTFYSCRLKPRKKREAARKRRNSQWDILLHFLFQDSPQTRFCGRSSRSLYIVQKTNQSLKCRSFFFSRINPRRRGKGSTKNMAEKRKRRRRLSRTRTSTENTSSIFLTAQK